MVSRLGSQVALLAFAAAVIAGLTAGNAPMTILTRALFVLAGSLFVGQFVGWSSRMVLRDHLQAIKHTIDRAHAAACEEAGEPVAEEAIQEVGRSVE